MPDYKTCGYCAFCWWADMESCHKCGCGGGPKHSETIQLSDTCERFKRSKYLGGSNE